MNIAAHLSVANNVKRAATVESKPAEKEDESAKSLKYVPVLWLFWVPVTPGSKKETPPECRHCARQVNNTGTSEVSNSASKQEVILAPRRRPAVSAPAPVNHNGINERDEHNRVL